MRIPATNFEALLGQARDCGLTQEFATAYEINVALDEADCCGGGGGGLPEQFKSTTYTNNGRYTVNPDEGYTLSAVNITVDVDQNLTVISELQLEVAQLEGEIATITSLNISENGTFTPPAGILGYNSIDVNVAGGGGSVEGDFGYVSTLSIYVPYNEPLPEQYYSMFNVIRAFSIGGNVNSISFPEGTLRQVDKIWYAFSSCSYLTSIVFPEESLRQVTGAQYIFNSCVSLTSVTFPEGSLTQVVNGQSMFQGCSSLTFVVFPEGALTQCISMQNCFFACSSLTSITFPEGALTRTTHISQTFNSCHSLTSITFPAGALTQARWMYSAFYNCSILSSITFPEGALTQVVQMTYAFYQCTSLQDLTIYNLPNIDLSNTGFTYCTRLTLSSLQNIVNALPTTTSGYQCTIGTTNLAKLSDTDIQIATDKGWTLN